MPEMDGHRQVMGGTDLARSGDTPGRILVIAHAAPYGASHDPGRGEGESARATPVRSLYREHRRGPALSSAILYLAIVAIWAVVLMPRWLRSRQAPPRAAESGPTAPAGASGQEASPGSLEAAGERDPGTGETGTDERLTVAGAREHAVPMAHGSRTSPLPTPQTRPEQGQDAEATWPIPAQRARILKARRRALVTLLMLSVGAVAIAVAHLAAWWVTVPPAAMLSGLLVLLRGAARIDAERARAAQARLARPSGHRKEHSPSEHAAAGLPQRDRPAADHSDAERATGPDHTTWPVPASASAAEIIDLSARFEDQLYDQYTDAAERAVGD